MRTFLLSLVILSGTAVYADDAHPAAKPVPPVKKHIWPFNHVAKKAVPVVPPVPVVPVKK